MGGQMEMKKEKGKHKLEVLETHYGNLEFGAADCRQVRDMI